MSLIGWKRLNSSRFSFVQNDFIVESRSVAKEALSLPISFPAEHLINEPRHLWNILCCNESIRVDESKEKIVDRLEAEI